MLVLTGIYAAILVATTVVGGIWSDRLGRRRVIVTVAGLVAASASLILALPQTWPWALAAVVLGAGYGVYTSVDFALITQVLPRGRAREGPRRHQRRERPAAGLRAAPRHPAGHDGGWLHLALPVPRRGQPLGSVLVYRIRSVR